MTKVLHINSYFSTSGLFSELYDRQVASGLDIDVYVPISRQYPDEKLAATGNYTKVSRNHHQYDRYLFSLKHGKILRDLKKSYPIQNYDLVHAHSLFSNGWLAYKLWQSDQIPYIVAVRSADIRTFFGKMPWMRKTGLKILMAAQKVVFISKNGFREVMNHYIPKAYKREMMAKSVIIANGVNPFWLDNLNHNKSSQIQSPIQIISVGKTLYEKRFVELAQMVKDYQKKHPIHLHIVGPNWDQAIVDQLKKYDHVTYHGPKDKEGLRDIFRQMDIFALLSSRETFGLVYVEAMSQGLPVLYTKDEGFDGYFEDGWVGVSVDIKDPQAFMRAMDQVIEAYPRFVQHALAESQKFEWDSINQTYLDLYDSLLKRSEVNEKS